MAAYRILYRGGRGEYEEKRSRFLAAAYPVHSEEEALALIAEEKKSLWDCRHHCYAYILGKQGELARFSDDGEPSGTAGKPILEVLKGSGATDLLVVVSRYFGGILLGTGGLVRAYTAGAKAALENAAVLDVESGEEWQLICEYSDLSRIDQAAERLGVPQGKREFASDVTTLFYLTENVKKEFIRAVEDASSGSALMEKLREADFSELEGKIILF